MRTDPVDKTPIFEHLTPAAASLLHDTPEQRIRAIEGDRWIFYPRAKQALGLMNRLVRHPRTTRMPSVAIHGDSGMGKSMIVERFRAEHPACFDPDAGAERTPVLTMQMKSRPGERGFYTQIITKLGAPSGPRATVVDLEQTAFRLMRAIGLQVLVIDEVHNILAGSHREQRIMLNTLRYLSNELRVSLVCFGIAEAREAISGDVQLARRFDELSLNRWSGNAEFEALVGSVLRNLPLREPSVLSAGALRRILQVTEGLTALVFRLLKDAAIEAIQTGREQVTDDAVERWKPIVDLEAAFA